MTQEEFASRLGVTPQAVSKWERRNELPDITLLAGICKILGIPVAKLIGIEENVSENGNVSAEVEIKNNLIAEPLVLEFGVGLTSCIVVGLETDYVNKQRLMLAKNTGKLMPIIHLRDNIEFKETQYRILSYDKVLYDEIIDEQITESYEEIINTVRDICDKHYDLIINKNIVKTMLVNLSTMYPGIVEDIIPSKFTYLQVKQELIKRLKEGNSIRNLIGILEEMEQTS